MKHFSAALFGIACIILIGGCVGKTSEPMCLWALIPVSALACITFYNLK